MLSSPLAVHGYNCLIKLLLATGLLGFANLLAVSGNLFKGELAIFEILTLAGIERCVAVSKHFLIRRLFEKSGCALKSTCHSIHTGDVCDEDILKVG